MFRARKKSRCRQKVVDDRVVDDRIYCIIKIIFLHSLPQPQGGKNYLHYIQFKSKQYYYEGGDAGPSYSAGPGQHSYQGEHVISGDPTQISMATDSRKKIDPALRVPCRMRF